MRSNNHCYTIQTNRQIPYQTPKSKLKETKYNRLFSLQKIRINPKGLPNDFFNPLVLPKNPPRHLRKHTRFNTISVETQEVRKTPQFQDSVVTQGYQPRQYKSQERKDRIDTLTKPFSEQQIKLEKQYTFSQSFFEEGESRFQRTNSKNTDEKKYIKQRVWQEQYGMSTPQRKEMGQLVSRKYMVRQKYLNLQYPRAVQPKLKNTLPLLKSRFPSAFGT